MQVSEIQTLINGEKIVRGYTLWKDDISHKVGHILTCGDKQWKITHVSYVRQGCFSTPTNRKHSIQIEPIDHADFPNKGDVLIKQ